MLALLFKFLGGGVAQALADAYKEKQNATTEQARIAAGERISRLEQIAAVQKAEAGWWINAAIRALFALPVAIYYGKLFLWDKVLKLGITDPLSEDMTWTARVIIGFYFIYEFGRVVTRRK